MLFPEVTENPEEKMLNFHPVLWVIESPASCVQWSPLLVSSHSSPGLPESGCHGEKPPTLCSAGSKNRGAIGCGERESRCQRRPSCELVCSHPQLWYSSFQKGLIGMPLADRFSAGLHHCAISRACLLEQHTAGVEAVPWHGVSLQKKK